MHAQPTSQRSSTASSPSTSSKTASPACLSATVQGSICMGPLPAGAPASAAGHVLRVAHRCPRVLLHWSVRAGGVAWRTAA